MTVDDEIVSEIRRHREELAATLNHDLDAMFRYYKQRERRSGRKYVSLVKKQRKSRHRAERRSA
jgi:hypothetical protein